MKNLEKSFYLKKKKYPKSLNPNLPFVSIRPNLFCKQLNLYVVYCGTVKAKQIQVKFYSII